MTWFLLAFLTFSLLPLTTLAIDNASQRILDLRAQIEVLNKQAEQYKGSISKTQKQATTLKNQIDILNNQILKLEIQIKITNAQVTETSLEISDLESQIYDKQQKIMQEKQTIGELMATVYERDRLSLFAVLLKSPTLSSFTDQQEQSSNLNAKIISLLTDLKLQKDQLQSQKDQLDQKKAELEGLNKRRINQDVSLSNTRFGKDRLLAQTKGQEAKFQALLSDIETKEAQFFNELRSLEAQAVKSGAFIVHVTAESVPPRGTKIFDWPFDSYYLTQGYGMTTYARRGAYGGAPHNGIDIVSTSGSGIHPIASGFVLASGNNSGWGNWIAIRHASNLVSLYGHMDAPSGLANNTPVSASSIIGYQGHTGNASGAHLHLSIYRDFFTYLNPTNGQLYFNYFDGTINPLDYL